MATGSGGFLRAEALAALTRWREVAAGAGLAALGLWWGLGAHGVLRWLGWALLLAGAAVVYAGVQRLRFRRGGGGQGVVQIDERRIAYFGPLTGGIVDLDDLARLDLDPRGEPAHWVLTPVSGAPVAIPVDAEGADLLFDAFAGLPGLGTERMLAALACGGGQPQATPVRLWQQGRVRLT